MDWVLIGVHRVIGVATDGCTHLIGEIGSKSARDWENWGAAWIGDWGKGSLGKNLGIREEPCH